VTYFSNPFSPVYIHTTRMTHLEIDGFEDLDTDGKIILEYMLQKGREGVDWIHLYGHDRFL